MRRGVWIGIGAWVSIVGLALAGPAFAEVHPVEVVGAYRIPEAMRGKVKPRDEAIRQALWEGVSQVALDLIGEEGEGDADAASATAGPGAAGNADSGTTPNAAPVTDATTRFRKIFGREILPYTQSFRILEDRGERPVLFADEPGVRSEYLVVVEVIVDVDRVTAELARAGLIARPTSVAASQAVTVELLGIDRYAGLARIVEALGKQPGVTRVETLEFAPARQVLRVSGSFGPEELSARLRRLESAELLLDPVEVDREGRRLRVRAQWIAAAPTLEKTPVSGNPGAPAAIRR